MKHISLWVILKVHLRTGKKILFEVLNMAKQLGLPTFFMTLSCADLPWDKLISIIASFRGEILMQEEMDHMDFFYKMHLSES